MLVLSVLAKMKLFFVTVALLETLSTVNSKLMDTERYNYKAITNYLCSSHLCDNEDCDSLL